VAVQKTHPDTTPRETRISAEELERELKGNHSSAAARAEAVRRAQVWEAAAAAEAVSARGLNPYVYQPRRGLRVGDEYQADIPEYEGPFTGHGGPALELASGHGEGPAVDGTADAEAPRAMDTAEDTGALMSDTQLTEKTRQLDARLKDITRLLARDMEQARACLGGLARILARILAEPGNTRIRRVNMQSGPYLRFTGGARQEARAFLQEVGFAFEDDGVHLRLARNDLGLVWLAKDMLAAANTVALGSMLTQAEDQMPMGTRA
jgi:hypothetical protein